ncbi:hypothetical protein V8C42DRAFT_132490 [Trichoderma barbatum]
MAYLYGMHMTARTFVAGVYAMPGSNDGRAVRRAYYGLLVYVYGCLRRYYYHVFGRALSRRSEKQNRHGYDMMGSFSFSPFFFSFIRMLKGPFLLERIFLLDLSILFLPLFLIVGGYRRHIYEIITDVWRRYPSSC